jgi:hypothetical protein
MAIVGWIRGYKTEKKGEGRKGEGKGEGRGD